MSERSRSEMPLDSRDHVLARGTIQLARFARESNGGGGGSRTRVREYAVEGIYMRSRPC